jgi:hypothetical protein
MRDIGRIADAGVGGARAANTGMARASERRPHRDDPLMRSKLSRVASARAIDRAEN